MAVEKSVAISFGEPGARRAASCVPLAIERGAAYLIGARVEATNPGWWAELAGCVRIEIERTIAAFGGTRRVVVYRGVHLGHGVRRLRRGADSSTCAVREVHGGGAAARPSAAREGVVTRAAKAPRGSANPGEHGRAQPNGAAPSRGRKAERTRGEEEPTRRPGRPPAPPGAGHDQIVKVRLTAAERAAWEALAEERGESLSDLVREAVERLARR